ncbi:hypothetical protein ABB27_14675 [Stenotrophomonas terrae]|uniref:Head decoration protein n=1 Tax=Stenotrophomonas terrae TaxID=405446 RepID=A0A0R0CHI0_9GAMM|nr:head decoration protein [Stenotrophomonas terrae]KRG65810.1 hypothetical protein ABB27_14675 [Stenotrophomonas terrae]
MNEQTEKNRTGDFLLSEGNGSYSRENIIVASGQNLEAGTVLGTITASGEAVGLDLAADDGSEVATGILWANTNATDADTAAVAIARAAEVKADALIWPAGVTVPQKTAAIAQLAELGVVLR